MRSNRNRLLMIAEAVLALCCVFIFLANPGPDPDSGPIMRTLQIVAIVLGCIALLLFAAVLAQRRRQGLGLSALATLAQMGVLLILITSLPLIIVRDQLQRGLLLAGCSLLGLGYLLLLRGIGTGRFVEGILAVTDSRTARNRGLGIIGLGCGVMIIGGLLTDSPLLRLGLQGIMVTINGVGLTYCIRSLLLLRREKLESESGDGAAE
ncbi:MAG: hypothetical protein GY835_14585 [bacterium]|nr:hypothetical protein [bacterium]